MKRKNVLTICVDHWPGSLLGAAGHPAILTPTLDSMASVGVRYSNAYAGTPSCIPARRAMMTGTTAKTHGDRVFNQSLPMPDLPTLAQTFVDSGYQAYAVGKLHVYPQRDRIGFQDVILDEEGRHHLGLKADDYELYLADEGYAGQEYSHGMCTNDYMTRTWHLPEHLHHTNWLTWQMCRTIKRRDPTHPAFWYLSYNFPHPPLVPLSCYMDLYRDIPIPEAHRGDWAQDFDSLPYALKMKRNRYPDYCPRDVEIARRAFYAQCTHIDHQIRLVIGLLREEELLDDTIILFTCDHGDMLGNHGMYMKSVAYEDSAHVPMILLPAVGDERVAVGQVDDRLVEHRDIMPTLLDLAGIPIPESVEGITMVGDEKRQYLTSEHDEDDTATRMIRDERYKLIYYPVGNRFHLFDMKEDPDEMRDLSENKSLGDVKVRLEKKLIEYLYGRDLEWVEDGRLKGIPDKEFVYTGRRDLNSQRGWRFMGG